VRGIQTVAVKNGERYLLTGEKMWISLADVADNFLVFAWTDLEKKKQRDTSGLSAFIVERAFKGFSSGTLTHKWGILAGNTGFFKMDEVEVPARTSSAVRVRIQGSRCSPSIRAASPWPRERPA
jgi:glutaryl-CoA dehydrogenase (non-decarboxylating)